MKPILFNTDMVRAILAGRKTVTRRVVKFPEGCNPGWTGYVPDGPVLYGSNNIPVAKSPYQPGDILYVRERVAYIFGRYVYRADYDKITEESKPLFKPSIHMPREAARIFLRVKAVRVEKLRSITKEDIFREGVQSDFYIPAFHDLWDSTIKQKDRAKYGWEANPWVWVIKFKRIDIQEAEHEKA